MKIIGKTDGGFLVDCTMNEIALLRGHDSRHASEFYAGDQHIGSRWKIEKIHEDAKFLRGVATQDLEHAKKQLSDIMDDIDTTILTVKKVQLFETIKKKSKDDNT